MFKFTQTLLTGTMRNIWSTMRRRCMLILGLQGLKRAPHTSKKTHCTSFTRVQGESVLVGCVTSRYSGNDPAKTGPEGAAKVEPIVRGMSDEGESWTNEQRRRKGYIFAVYAAKTLYSRANNTATNAGY